MELSRTHVEMAFADYVRHYDASDPKIALKIVHTRHVAHLCGEIATSLGLSSNLVDLAWTCGMLHDIGRFEQIARFHTFADGRSIDHALLGAQVLIDEGAIRSFLDDASLYPTIAEVVRQHNRLTIDKTLDAQTTLMCKIVRDADKIDILRVNCESQVSDIYDFDEATLAASPLSSAVVDSFARHITLDRTLRRYPADYLVGHVSFAFGLEFDASVRILDSQGHLYQMFEHEFSNEDTHRQFHEMETDLRAWIDERLER